MTILMLVLLAGSLVGDEVLPPGFQDKKLDLDWDQPVGLRFAPDGRLYVWEKKGVVWIVEDGVKDPEPFLDLSEEVANFDSKGMKGLALDPDFYSNGHVYLLYEVDRHHLFHYGSPQYDPDADDFSVPTISRITRYTADSSDGFRSVDPATRLVLLGESVSTGFPNLGHHDSGCLAFGLDGSLLASCGDGNESGNSFEQALAEGLVEPKEDVDIYRSQLIDGLNGKIVRLDPATGDGLPDNPFYVDGAPRAARSRVWCYGLRNPFRFTVAPGSAPPGTLLIGDVGANDWEEFNVSHRGAENFGWPYFEGMTEHLDEVDNYHDNLDAPNPLYDGTTCTQEYFYFQDLLVQDTLNPPSWPNPCDPAVEVPPSALPSMHERPTIDWGHEGPARTKIYDANGHADEVDIGDPSSPIVGEQFLGNCSIGGVWYDGDSFPFAYHDSYFHAEYAGNWVKHVTFDALGNPTAIDAFGNQLGSIIDLAMHPVTGDLYYVALLGSGELHRISYFDGNIPPVAVASAEPLYGPEPLSVQLTGSDSYDPEGLPLSFEWSFGDGTPPSRLADPLHTFPLEDVTDDGRIIAYVLDELDPPQTNLGDGFDPEVIRDGVFPVFGTVKQQYFTYSLPLEGKTREDWVGYEFARPMRFETVVFQEGESHPPFGGWWNDLRVQVRSPSRVDPDARRLWTDVQNAVISPAYTGDNGVYFEVFEVDFDPVQGDAIRIVGTPGGNWKYVGISELRVLARSKARPTPKRFDVTLTVTDDFNTSDSVTFPVWTNNTPPQITITSPRNGSSYDASDSVTFPLTADVFDLEHPTDTLTCQWQINLHHDNHVHPEPSIGDCASQFTLEPHDEGEGEVLWWEVILTVTDPLGLSSSRSHFLYPQHDCNLNGYDDLDDIATGRSQDWNLNNIPDECEEDCNGNGLQDPFDIVIGLSEDLNEDGIPDECQ